MVEQNVEYRQKLEDKLDQGLAKEEKSLVGFFIKNFRFTYLIIITIVFLGVYSLLTLPREANPEIKVPYAMVTTILPGATPADVEDLITDKIEEKVQNLADLNLYTSSSGQGVSSVFVEFEAAADLAESFRKLREAADQAEPDLPEQAESPVVTEINFSDIPIVTYSLVGDYSDIQLKQFADRLEDEFKNINNVSRVTVLGGLEREFQVIVDQTKLANYNISLGQVVNAIARANFNLPSGNIKIDGFKYNVRVEGKFKEAALLKEIVVTTLADNTPVYIGDLAQVSDGFKEKQTESRIGLNSNPPRNTISLQIYKKTGGNILDIVKQSKETIARLQNNQALPADLIIQKTNDNSVFIKEDLTRLGLSGLQTMALIILILLIVLNFRGAFITGLSVPIAFLMAFIGLNLIGMTLNSLVLFSLVLSLGLMVDNSIVIIEGINEYVNIHNRPIYQAAILSVWNFKWPITAGTLTTVAAFLPILLVSGILGEFLSVMPKTITLTLLSSLVVAIIIIPTLVTRFLKINGFNGSKPGQAAQATKTDQHRLAKKLLVKLQNIYAPLLSSILPNKKKRRIIIALAWLLFLLSIALPASGLMKIEMFPKVDVDYFIINIKLPAGSALEKTETVTSQVEAIVATVPEVDNYVTNLGTAMSLALSDESGGLSAGAGGASSHLANITVNLIDKKERRRASYEIAESLRPQLDLVQGASVTAEELSAGPPSGSPIEVRIFGEDLNKLAALSHTIVDYFKTVPGVINASDSLEETTADFTFTVDKQKADFYGLDVNAIAATLRTAVYGATASTITLAGDEVDITVKYSQDDFTNANDLKNILLFSPKSGSIPLKQVAQVKFEPSLLSIGHRDGQRIVTVTADTEAGVNLNKIFADFEQFKNSLELPSDYTIAIGGELEEIDQSFREVFLSMILAVILIAVILVLQFNSFRQPLIILFSLPLAIIGVIVGLNLLRLPFSFTAFIGIVALAGIAVNDAIVLIDRINKNIATGLDFIESIIEGGLARMQPVFLTSLTTIAGIFPLIFADELWRGLAITVIAGLIFSTVLTLIMVPIIYAGLCRKEKCQ